MTDLFYPYPRKEDLKRLAESLESVGFDPSQGASSSQPGPTVTDDGNHWEGIDKYTLCINPLLLNDSTVFSSIVNKAINANPNRRLTGLTFMEEKADGAYSDCLLQADVKTEDDKYSLQTIRDDSSGLPALESITVDAKIKDDGKTVIQNYIDYDEALRKFKGDYSGILPTTDLDSFKKYVNNIGKLPDISSKRLILTFTCKVDCGNGVHKYPIKKEFDLFALLSKSGYLGDDLKKSPNMPFDMRKYLMDNCKKEKDLQTVSRKIEKYLQLDMERLTGFFKTAFERPAVIVKKGLQYYDNLYEAIISQVVKQEELKVFFPETMNVDNTYSLVLNPFFSKFRMTDEEAFIRLFSLSGISEFEEKTQAEDFLQKQESYHAHVLASVFTKRIIEIPECSEIDKERLYEELLSIVRQDDSPKRTILTDDLISEITKVLDVTISKEEKDVDQPKKQTEKEKQNQLDIEYIEHDHAKRVALSLNKFLKRLQGSNERVSNSDEANSNERVSISDEADEVKKMMLHTGQVKPDQNLNWHTVNMDYLILHYSLCSTFPTSESISINDAVEMFKDCINKIDKIPKFNEANNKPKAISNIKEIHKNFLIDFFDSVLKGKEIEPWAEAWSAIALYDCIKRVDKLLKSAKGTVQKYLLYDAYLRLGRTKQFKSQRRLWESYSWLQEFMPEPGKKYDVKNMPNLVDENAVKEEVMAGQMANTGASDILTMAIKAQAPQ